ncbi:MAG: excinuclease ABC subunit UvrC [Candidatus Atribacteria bacterium]|nr:excinuclease ABC subunit UvrC [Candidatus Atribacteria bacterium]MCK4309737.1 excinuclease ABC subunit UvrC [Candidatus Atribacteria bacterium]
MDIKSKVNKLPDTGGVYLFKDKANKIIYVGKANSLKSRVSSYFSNSSQRSLKANKMVKEIMDVEYIPTSSEVEALILESKMIKNNNPYYNTQFKDDKSYPYIKITLGEDFPQIFFHRKINQEKKEDKAIYFGPFVGAEDTRAVIKVIRQIFKIRGCRKKNLREARICLDYQIGLCSAPCAKMISKTEYQKRVKEICLFLAGGKKRLLHNFYQEMKEASNHINYEKAAKIRDKIKSLEEILKSQELNYYSKDKGNEYFLKKIEEVEESEIKKGKRAIFDLKRKLNLKILPEKIEAFDISNIQGKLPVGSLVVFEKGRPKKQDYRRFKVKKVNRIDDYAMLQEVVERRYKRLLSEGKELPDLILIDGGRGQLVAVEKILNTLSLELPVISIAKKEEEIFKPEVYEPIILPPDSEALFLLQRIRDEAHRFAITYHRRIRSKELRNSKLDLIPGIGSKRKRLLLKYFKSIEEIKNASTVEISKIPGFGKKIAETIKAVLEVRK